ncbi:PAS domain-containing sensor histidine kinase [Brevibacillus reuszeri]|nr:PAS domain-containing sensor histidine kinase [Brevibacillus reuszeri]KNB70064.1 sporulation kinase [Brevibacillus reuszeri]MED1857078.1 PAS domain S-box protein [Brevibacillus reuszeri]
MAKPKTPYSWKKKRSKKKSMNRIITDQILKAFFHYTTDTISISDMDGDIILVNQAFENYYGWSMEEVHQSPSCFIPDDLIIETRQLFEAVRSMGVHITNYETIRKRKDGTLIDVTLSATPIVNEEGTIIGASCITRDITDRKKTEEALKATEAKYRLLIDHTQDIVSIYDETLKLIYVSPSIEQQLGYLPEEYTSLTGLDILHPEDQPLLLAKQQEILDTKQPLQFEARVQDKDGRWISFEIRGIPFVNDSGTVQNIMLVSRNVMERKHSEAALLKSEEKHRIIAEHTDDFIMITDINGDVVYLSPSHERIHGNRKQSGIVTLIDVHTDDRPLVVEHFKKLLATKEPQTCEFRYHCVDGSMIVLESKGVPIFSPTGECDGFIIVSRDITERRNNEDLLRKTEKLSMIGELAAGIAHEIRNPLTALKGFVQLLYPTLNDKKMYADIMLSELERINFIVSELLVLAKPQNVQIRHLSLVGLLENVLALLASEANLKNIHFHTSFPEAPIIAGEEIQLKQVFLNIIKNSIEAIAGQGEIHVSTRLLASNQVIVRLADNGCGISEDIMPRLGEPFFTTKENGTGLGLMISSKIIKDHHGSLHISSHKEEGTVIEITLPIVRR